MYLRIRRAESITSILLFIFNVFLTEKKVTELPLKKILKILEPFKKNETAVRMGLSRGVQNGLLVNVKKEHEVYYQLTDLAIQSLKHWGKTMRTFQQRVTLQKEAWSGKWNIIYFLVTVTDELAYSLRQLDYGALEKHLWISPYDFSKEILALAGEKGLSNSMYLFRSELIGNRQPGEIVSEVWPVEELNKKYIQYITDLKKAIKELDTEFLQGGAILPFLHQYGLRIFEIMQDDPQLPLQLLPPDWSGIQATQLFTSTREQLLPKANAFIAETIELK